MEGMEYIKVKDAGGFKENEPGCEPIVQVPLFWLERLIRESERYRHRTTDEIDDLHDRLARIEQWIDKHVSETVRKESRKKEETESTAETPKTSENAVKTPENTEKAPENARKCTETEKNAPELEGFRTFKPRTRGTVDDGKIKALFTGKPPWTVKEIASEMGLSEQTIRNHLHAMGLMS